MIRVIRDSDTWPVRQKVLRPHQQASDMSFPFDDNPESMHLGFFTGGEVVGILSVYPMDRQEKYSREWYRIRGMAVVPDQQGQGVGHKLMDEAFKRLERRVNPGSQIWCNARTSAVGFYEKHGFIKEGDEFEIQGVGPHFVMVRAIHSS